MRFKKVKTWQEHRDFKYAFDQYSQSDFGQLIVDGRVMYYLVVDGVEYRGRSRNVVAEKLAKVATRRDKELRSYERDYA